MLAAVTEEERAAAIAFTAVPRSLASAAGPGLAGLLIAAGWEEGPFLVCGLLKIVYDLLLLAAFRRWELRGTD